MNALRTGPTIMTKPGRKPSGKPAPGEMTTRAFRMRQQYADWLEDFAILNRTSLAGLFDQAIAEYAKVKGFKAPPQRT
jgi:hypothetical protein